MMFKGYLRWCAARPEYRKLIDRDAGKAPAILENLPSNTKRIDAIEAAQLPGWWQGVEQLSNRTASVYRPRSVDALRPYLEKIETHILEQAGVTFNAKAEPGKLRVVVG